MIREEIYKNIDGERQYGLLRWGVEGPDGKVVEHPRALAEFVHHIQTFLGMAAVAATVDTTPGRTLNALREVAALCVAAFEQHGCPPRLAEFVENKRNGRTYKRETGEPALPSRKRAAKPEVT